ncbi:hypothetical protein N431DRAFT_557408 [Stipitochalara longipes BDJ]|nr:hypothetical protein N431DRAFT_557408 [Stipitochalara longipes BDJ]
MAPSRLGYGPNKEHNTTYSNQIDHFSVNSPPQTLLFRRSDIIPTQILISDYQLILSREECLIINKILSSVAFRRWVDQHGEEVTPGTLQSYHMFGQAMLWDLLDWNEEALTTDAGKGQTLGEVLRTQILDHAARVWNKDHMASMVSIMGLESPGRSAENKGVGSVQAGGSSHQRAEPVRDMVDPVQTSEEAHGNEEAVRAKRTSYIARAPQIKQEASQSSPVSSPQAQISGEQDEIKASDSQPRKTRGLVAALDDYTARRPGIVSKICLIIFWLVVIIIASICVGLTTIIPFLLQLVVLVGRLIFIVCKELLCHFRPEDSIEVCGGIPPDTSTTSSTSLERWSAKPSQGSSSIPSSTTLPKPTPAILSVSAIPGETTHFNWYQSHTTSSYTPLTESTHTIVPSEPSSIAFRHWCQWPSFNSISTCPQPSSSSWMAPTPQVHSPSPMIPDTTCQVPPPQLSNLFPSLTSNSPGRSKYTSAALEAPTSNPNTHLSAAGSTAFHHEKSLSADDGLATFLVILLLLILLLTCWRLVIDGRLSNKPQRKRLDIESGRGVKSVASESSTLLLGARVSEDQGSINIGKVKRQDDEGGRSGTQQPVIGGGEVKNQDQDDGISGRGFSSTQQPVIRGDVKIQDQDNGGSGWRCSSTQQARIGGSEAKKPSSEAEGGEDYRIGARGNKQEIIEPTMERNLNDCGEATTKYTRMDQHPLSQATTPEAPDSKFTSATSTTNSSPSRGGGDLQFIKKEETSLDLNRASDAVEKLIGTPSSLPPPSEEISVSPKPLVQRESHIINHTKPNAGSDANPVLPGKMGGMFSRIVRRAKRHTEHKEALLNQQPRSHPEPPPSAEHQDRAPPRSKRPETIQFGSDEHDQRCLNITHSSMAITVEKDQKQDPSYLPISASSSLPFTERRQANPNSTDMQQRLRSTLSTGSSLAYDPNAIYDRDDKGVKDLEEQLGVRGRE